MLRAAETISKTDTGRQRRDNEDKAYARSPVFVVADGMGGARAGEVASQVAIEVFEQGLPEGGSPEERLADRVREANRRIYQLSRAERDRAGMGTTLTAAYLDDAHVAIAHVGDSRAYLFRDGRLKRLTQDHSLVSELVSRGKLTEEQAAEHPQRSIITRALGPEPEVEVDTWTYPVRAADILLLCSDGLTSMISEQRVSKILSSTTTLDQAGDQLIEEANSAGGRDNITVVLFRLEEVGTDGATDAPTTISKAAAPPTASAPPEGAAAVALAPPAKLPPRVIADPRGAPPPGDPRGAPPPGDPRGAPPPDDPRGERRAGPPAGEPRARRRHPKLIAGLVALVVVLFLVLGGGYLASRQLYFIGTNSSGIVTIYRGLPYDLPAGLHLYETFYVSGVPASQLPADRRSSLLDNRLRSQTDASSLVRDLELGKVAK